jgi:hypothetical protein
MHINIEIIMKMKQPTWILLAVFATILASCSADSDENEIPIDQLTFDSIFGSIGEDEYEVYCLLGEDFFEVGSDNSDSLITSWLDHHKSGTLTKISRVNGVLSFGDDAKLIYSMVTDGKENLNVYLVRNGGFPASAMQRPKTWEEMNADEKQLYSGMEKPSVDILIDSKTYKKYMVEIREAEELAKNEKLGVWSDEFIDDWEN